MSVTAAPPSAIPNDISSVIEADRAHVWHHLLPHKPLETTDPRIIVEGKGMKVWDQKGKEHIFMFAAENWIIADATPANKPSSLFGPNA